MCEIQWKNIADHINMVSWGSRRLSSLFPIHQYRKVHLKEKPNLSLWRAINIHASLLEHKSDLFEPKCLNKSSTILVLQKKLIMEVQLFSKSYEPVHQFLDVSYRYMPVPPVPPRWIVFSWVSTSDSGTASPRLVYISQMNPRFLTHTLTAPYRSYLTPRRHAGEGDTYKD